MNGEQKESVKMTLIMDTLLSKDKWTIQELEDFFDYDIDKDDEKEEDSDSWIGIPSMDAYSLHCRRFTPSTTDNVTSTVMGLYESIMLELGHDSIDNIQSVLMNESVTLRIYQWRDDGTFVGKNNDLTTMVPTMRDWSAIMPSKQPQCTAKQQWGMSILDLTTFPNSHDGHSNQQIYSFLQELAQIHDPTLHGASPWYYSCSGKTLRQGLAVVIPTSCRDNWKQFCVGHAIPSYQLHSIVSPLIPPFPCFCGSISTNDDITLLTYRPLPPRTFIQPTLTDLLYENPTIPIQIPNDDHINDPLYEDMFWETYPLKLKNDNDDEEEEEEDDIVIWKVRQIATPFQNAHDIFPLLIQPIMDAIPIFQKEVQQNIPSTWTPWPETSHYNTQNSWTIFPICHTFPATDLSTRTWISSTWYVIHCTLQRNLFLSFDILLSKYIYMYIFLIAIVLFVKYICTVS